MRTGSFFACAPDRSLQYPHRFFEETALFGWVCKDENVSLPLYEILMPKDTKTLGYNKALACESRGLVHKKEGALFDTPSSNKTNSGGVPASLPRLTTGKGFKSKLNAAYSVISFSSSPLTTGSGISLNTRIPS